MSLYEEPDFLQLFCFIQIMPLGIQNSANVLGTLNIKQLVRFLIRRYVHAQLMSSFDTAEGKLFAWDDAKAL